MAQYKVKGVITEELVVPLDDKNYNISIQLEHLDKVEPKNSEYFTWADEFKRVEAVKRKGKPSVTTNPIKPILRAWTKIENLPDHVEYINMLVEETNILYLDRTSNEASSETQKMRDMAKEIKF